MPSQFVVGDSSPQHGAQAPTTNARSFVVGDSSPQHGAQAPTTNARSFVVGDSSPSSPRLAYVAYSALDLQSANSIQTFHTCRALAERTTDLTIIVPRFSINEPRPPFPVVKIPRIPLNKSSRLWRTTLWNYAERTLFAWLAGLYLLLRRVHGKPTGVIYSRDTIVAFWFVLWGARVIYEVHDLESEHPSKIASPRVRRWMARVDGKTLRGARGVVSLTETFKNALVRWGWQPEARVWVIPDAFDETTFYPRPRDECRAALGIPRDALVVAYAGMTFAYRGLETLLEAFRLWSEPRARLYLIGGRPFEIDALKAEAHAWGLGDAVVFTGKLPGEKTAQYLNAADILVIPGTVTTATASPLKMFEYMALARPIVAVDLPALREILHDDAALFFSTGMARELQACLVHLAADPARAAALAARARERVAPFTYARRAEKILEAIRTVMSF